MAPCYDEGQLRAYLDDALPPAERAAIATHLGGCASCQEQLAGLQALVARTGALLALPETVSDPRAALARLQREQREGPRTNDKSWSPVAGLWPKDNPPSWRTRMQSPARFWSRRRQPLFAGLAAAAVAMSLLLFPAVRAAADQLLQVFRVRNVMFMPISPDRIAQLESLNFDEETLFVAKPTVVNNPAPPRTVGSVDEAAQLVDFAPQQPAAFPTPPVSSETVVHDRTVGQFQVNVAASRQLLELMGVTDVTIPDALGAQPITADMPSAVESRYHGTDYELTLIQGRSPDVNLPEGVDLQQLAKAGLRLLGMEPQAAESLSRTVDWSSTLVFPFPANISNVRQVSVGDAPGLLVGDDSDAESHWHLYWQRGDRFYVLQSEGLQDSELLAAAESIR